MLWLVRFAFSKEEDEEEEHGQSVKIVFTCISHLEKIILCYTVQNEDQFPCKSSGWWFTRIISYDIYGVHYNVLSGPIISCFTRSKNKLYAYALAQKKTGLHAKFQAHRCYR